MNPTIEVGAVVRLNVEIANLSSDGQTYGEGDEECLFQIRDEPDEMFVERGGRLLGVLRARSIAIDAWRHEASRLSLRAPWPIPTYFSAEGRGYDRKGVSLCVTLETRDARIPRIGAEVKAPFIWVQHTELAPLASPRADRIRRYVELTHAAIRHEVDEHIFVDDQRANDPHAVCATSKRPRGTMTGTADVRSLTVGPAQIAPPRRVVKLTISIERFDGEVLAEDFIVQADAESDQHFITRAVIILEALRLRSGTLPTRKDLTAPVPSAWPSLPRIRFERDCLDRLETLVRTWTDLGDAVLAGLVAVYGLHEAAAVRPGTMPREVLHRYSAETGHNLAAISALIAALEEHERCEASAPEAAVDHVAPRS